MINSPEIYQKAIEILKSTYGPDAQFKEGQYEAIESTLLNKRSLVVQKTGWGKSIVYFISTKILRQQGKGVTLVISPLISLMNNQFDSAKQLGLTCNIFNSETKDEHDEILHALELNKIDLLLITPESLFSKKFIAKIEELNIGLFVIDEAHCISDWGHDFRLKYSQLYNILEFIPQNVPILATTATANNRVIKDLEAQIGLNQEVHISRGNLMRNNLKIQVLKLPSKLLRYAWILENINELDGTGIIYCLTKRDCDALTDFLIFNNINARSYHAGLNEAQSKEILDIFYNNEIKVIVSTIKLGMGYDKGDVSFIIHYQQPSNLVSYYQQIGRAGRNISYGQIFLMTGVEDILIQNYFINSAFPLENDFRIVLDYIFNNVNDGVTLNNVLDNLNLRATYLEKILMFLENDGYIYVQYEAPVNPNNNPIKKYYSTIKVFEYNKDYYDEITTIRKNEQLQMEKFVNLEVGQCYNKYIVNCLDDNTTENCGVCVNCTNIEILPSKTSDNYITKALEYQSSPDRIIPIVPKKMWRQTNYRKKIQFQNLEGVCLSNYGQPIYGKFVQEDKYSNNDYFRDELVTQSVIILKKYIKQYNLTAITSVPSFRSSIVENFARRLAQACGLQYIELLTKDVLAGDNKQKNMNNAVHQCMNAINMFRLLPVHNLDIENIILIDDIVDSNWTLAVCGELLMSSNNNNIRNVFPFALADTSNS